MRPILATALLAIAATAPAAASAADRPGKARLGAPRAVKSAAADRAVRLRWRSSRPATHVRRYRIYLRAQGGKWRKRPVAVTERRSLSVRELVNGRRYGFRVGAVDRRGRSGRLSRPVYAVPAAAPGAPVEPVVGAPGQEPVVGAPVEPVVVAPGQEPVVSVPGQEPTPPEEIPEAGPGCPLFGPYKAGNWPGSCWRPYAATSPFNRPIPANPPLLANSAQIVQRLLSWGGPQKLLAGHADTSEDYFHPLYYAQPSDPLYTVHCTRWTRDCPVEGAKLRIPGAARGAGGDDGHMTVIDQVDGWEYDFWQVADKPALGGTLTVSHGGRTRIDGDGLGSNATAAWFGLAAGIIRGPEVEAGVIPHALFSQVKCSGGYAVYPARAGTAAAPCSNFGASNTDAPPLGARIQLAMSDAEIDALPAPDWKKTILKALAHYGLIVGDTMNNHSSWGLQGESGSSYTSFGAIDPWATIAGGMDGLDIGSGVDWSRFRVVHPCVSQGTC